MALEIFNVSVTTAAQVAILPPNATISFSIATGGATAFIGTSSSVTTANGFAVSPGVPHTFYNPPTSQAYNIWAVSGTTSALGIIITTTA